MYHCLEVAYYACIERIRDDEWAVRGLQVCYKLIKQDPSSSNPARRGYLQIHEYVFPSISLSTTLSELIKSGYFCLVIL